MRGEGSFVNPSNETLDIDAGVDVNFALGFGGATLIFHGFHPWLFLLGSFRVRFCSELLQLYPSKESFDINVSVDLNSASGFAGAMFNPHGFRPRLLHT